MKSIALFFLSSVLACAQSFLTGQAARITIGQTNFTSQSGDASSQYQIGAAGGVAFANNTLFVADGNVMQAPPVNNRVLIYTNVSSFIPPVNAPIQQGVRCRVCIGTNDVGGASVVLGEPNFTSFNYAVSSTGMRTASHVATDGNILVVSDSDNNRVLLWKTIPTSMDQPADLVLGQPDMNTANPPAGPSAKNLRGPEGLWVQGTRLFVADTNYHRVLIWNTIPTTNDQSPDVVLGEPNFTSTVPDTTPDLPPTASNLFYPVAVSSDGQRLFVSDLGHDRVLIWNNIPTSNNQPADLVVGQPDMSSEVSNNVTALCASNGTDTNGNPTYPTECSATMDEPRFALSDGTRLFIADGGNDRVLVFNTLPTSNGAHADAILGQVDEFTDLVSDNTDTVQPDAAITISAANEVRTPTALAWDPVNQNLYVADPFEVRVLVFSPGASNIPINGVNNAASMAVFAIGTVDFSGTITANDTVTIEVNSTSYTYKVLSTDTLTTIIQALVAMINGTNGTTPDPNVTALPNLTFSEIILTAKASGAAGNAITYSTTSSTNATEILTAGGANLSGGTSAAEVAPLTQIIIAGTNLSDNTASVPANAQVLPTTLGGVQLYFDGILAPLFSVSPTQIVAEVPVELQDTSSSSSFVLTTHNDGTVTASTSLGIPIVGQNPGIYAGSGADPRPVVAYHSSSYGIGVVSVDGGIQAGDVATVGVGTSEYNYTVQAADALPDIRDALILQINADPNAAVVASAAGQFTRIILTAKVQGPAGDGIPISVNQTNLVATATPEIVITAFNNTTCCANSAGALVTTDNPAIPGEIISVRATGLGLVLANNPDQTVTLVDGVAYNGPPNNANAPVDNAIAGGLTANVLQSGLVTGLIGVYEVQLQLDSTLPSNPLTQLYIAQNVFTSNIVTIPVVAPNPNQ